MHDEGAKKGNGINWCHSEVNPRLTTQWQGKRLIGKAPQVVIGSKHLKWCASKNIDLKQFSFCYWSQDKNN